jgi:hypothetical protein
MSFRVDYDAQLDATVARNPQAQPTRPSPANPTRARTPSLHSLARPSGTGTRSPSPPTTVSASGDRDARPGSPKAYPYIAFIDQP